MPHLSRFAVAAPAQDFAVKRVDVAPEGTAYIPGDTILRTRYRDAVHHAGEDASCVALPEAGQ